MSEHVNDAALGTAGGTPRPNPVDVFYRHCLGKAIEEQARGDVAAALTWLSQAEFVGSITLERRELPEVATAYVRLLAGSCREAFTLAVRSGNIIDAHVPVAANLKTIAERLLVRLNSQDCAVVARAAVIEGHARRLSAAVSELRASKPLVVPAVKVEDMIEDLEAIVTNAGQLGIPLDSPYGTSAEVIALCLTAVLNARYSLSWLLPSRLSDWQRAALMCRCASRLLSHHRSLESGSPAGRTPSLDRARDLVKASEASVAARNYRASWRSLKDAELELLAATR